MIEYLVKRTGKIHKKKEGFLKSKSAEVIIADEIDHTHTLSTHVGKLKSVIRERYGRLPGRLKEEEEVSRALSKAITHTHDHFSLSKRYGHIHQSKKDAQKWNILFQLLTVLPAVKYKRTNLKDVGKRTERILQALEKEHGEPVFYYRMEDDVPRRKYIVLPPYDPREGKLLPPFEKLKKDPEFRKKFIDIFLEAHEMPKSRYGEKMEKYLQLAMNAAEEVAEFLGEDGKALVKPEELARLEKLTRYLDTLMREEFYLRPVEKREEQKQAAPAARQAQVLPKKPKFPEAKKAVEEELRKAGVPEQQIKVVAPRLATAVWLDKWFENAAKSYTYKKLGGVPLDEIKNLRNMILAKKHLAEVAAKIMEEHWTRGNHVQITEEHVNPKLLPLVREHAQGMFEDLENIRKQVKEGKMSVEEAINLMNVERNLLDMAHEHVERLMGSPEHLAKNPRPLGPEDEYVIRLPGIIETHRKLKPHLEKARPVILKKK